MVFNSKKINKLKKIMKKLQLNTIEIIQSLHKTLSLTHTKTQGLTAGKGNSKEPL